MAEGTDYTVTASNGSCESTSSAIFNNAPMLETPSVPLIASTAATCSSAEISTISNYNASATYTFTGAGTPMVIAGGIISGMTLGTDYTVTATLGTCISAASATFNNAMMLETPATPTITSVPTTCSSAETSTIGNYNSALTYTFSPAGTVTVGSGGLINGMAEGTDYTVTASNGSCESTSSAIFNNAPMLETPSVPLIASTAATCSSAEISTISNYNASATYTFTGAGTPMVIAGGIISGMTVGTDYTVTAALGTCISAASATFNNAMMLETPATPTITSVPTTCSSAETSTIGNYNSALTYTFSPAGTVTVGSGGLINGMAEGTDYTVTASNGSCESTSSAIFNNAPMLETPSVPLIASTAATCSSAEISTISNYNASATYTFTGAGTPMVIAGGIISGMTLGTDYTVTAALGTCISAASATFNNAMMLETPATPTITSVPTTCSSAETSTIGNYNSALTYTFSPAGTVTVGSGGLINGMAEGTDYTVTASNGSCESTSSAIFNNAPMLETPSVPLIASTAATCSSAEISTISNYNASATYTFTGAGTPMVIAGGIISGMTLGTDYTVTATLGTCISAASATFNNAMMLETPATPTITSVPTTCSSAETSTIGNYNSALTYTFSPAGTVTVGSGGLINGMAEGTDYTVTASNGSCESTSSAIFNNAPMLETPSVPLIASTAATCSSAEISTISNYNASATYTFTGAGTPMVIAGGIISGMTLGTDYTVTATLGTCISAASATFNNAMMLETPATPTITSVPTTCSSAETSTIGNYNSALTYTFSPAGTVTVGSGGLINGMAEGTDYTVTASNGSCESTSSAIFNNAPMLETPSVPLIASTVATCSSAEISTISNYNASATYTFTGAGTPMVIAGGIISGMTVGTDYTVTAALGTCISAASATFNNAMMLETPATPTITSVPTTCSSAETSTIGNYNSALTYTFSPAGTVTVGSGGLINGMAEGTDYTVTASNGSCESTSSAIFNNAPMLETPSVPLIASTAATCSSAEISTISNYNASATYTFTGAGTPMVIAGGIISGMTLGTDYTVTAALGTCISAASATFNNAMMLETPATPTITSVPTTCSSAETSTIGNYNSALTYTFSPAGTVTVGSGGLINGMAEGTDYTVTASNGSCESTSSAIFNNAPMLETPSVPLIASTAATCSSAEISTISNYNASATYTFTGAGTPMVIAGGIISGMTVGTDYTVTATLGTCISAASATFNNAMMLETPATPTITSVPTTCSSAETSTIGNYNSALTYTFSPAGTVTVGSGGLINGMAEGTDYTVTASNGSCESTSSAIFNNAPMLETPSVPLIASTVATCSSAEISTISNYNASATYTFTGAGTPMVIAGGIISGMTVGTDYTVTATLGTCISAASATFNNAMMLETPATPTITSVPTTCSSAETSTIGNYNSALTYTFSPAGTVTVGSGGLINGMAEGTDYTVTASNGSCESTSSAIFNNAPMLETPSVPLIASTAATCSSAEISTISNYNASATYTFTGAGTPMVIAGGIISGMTLGTDYTVTAALGTCISAASATFNNAMMLETPATPTITSVPTTCSSAETSTIGNYNSALTYTFSPAGTVTVGSGGLINGMAEGTDYTVTASNGSCESTSSAIFNNAPMLETPSVPLIASTAATCSSAEISTISNYNASATYTFTGAGTPMVIAGGIISGMTVGTDYTVTATLGTCISAASATFNNAMMLETPATPTITSVPTTCSSAETSTIGNYNSALTYTFSPAGTLRHCYNYLSYSFLPNYKWLALT